MTVCFSQILRAGACFTVFFLVLTAPAVRADIDRFEALDVFELEYAADPQVSPDGGHVVYVRTSMDIMTDTPRRNLWLIDAESGSQRPLLSSQDSYTSPRWSPNGDRLAYLSNVEGSTQLYIRWMDTGQTALISNLSRSPQNITWSPDGQWLAFVMSVPADRAPLASMPEKPAGAEWAEGVKQIDTLVYRADGQGFLKPGWDHLFVIPAEGGSPRQLTQGEYDHAGPLSWSSDGGRIYFSTNRAEDREYDTRESDVWSIQVDSGELARLTVRKGPDKAPTISPDGKYLAYLGHDERLQGANNDQVYLMDLVSGESRSLTSAFDRNVQEALWASDGKSLWLRYEDRGTQRLARVDLQGQIFETPLLLSGTTLGRPYASGAFSVSGRSTLVFTQGSSLNPADVALSRNGRNAKTLTQLNQDLLSHKRLGQVEKMTWRSSHDDLEIEGWIMTPPDFDPQYSYPMILEIHGGPHAAYGPNFSAEAQLYAAAGYVVLYANPRGSTSYGDQFANEIYLAYPGYDYDDLMSGVDALIERGFVDPEQLFVTGGSGGGTLTAWIVGKTDRFRAAVVAKPVINWISFTLTADSAPYFTRYWFDGPAWEKTQDYWRRSPLSLVGNVTTPTLLLTGEADYRTPIGETEQYYQALKQRKIDTMMIRIPGAPHGIAGRPSRLVAKVNNILAWFERYRGTE